VVQFGGDENMLIRLFFKHIVVILVICAALLGFFRFDDLAQWVPSFVVRGVPSAKMATASEHVVTVPGGTENQKVSEAISQRRNGQSNSNLKPVSASDSRERGVSSQTDVEFVFQHAMEDKETLPEPDVGVVMQAGSRDEVVADVTPVSDESSRQAHKTQSTTSTQTNISSAVSEPILVAESEEADALSSGGVSVNAPRSELTEGVSGAQLKTTAQPASKQTASVTDESVGKTMRAPDLSRGRGPGQRGAESAHMNKFGDVTQREVETNSRQPLPLAGTADDAKSLPTPLVKWIPPTGEPKEDAKEAAETAAAQRQTVQKIWVDARNAFWNRDLAMAELKYHALSAKLPDNPDVMGELGNVFYVQGKHKQTVAAYYRAAELLIEKGRSNRVLIILDLLYKLEPEKANTLRARMARMHDDVEG
jgi:hypothetical protein